MTDLPLVDVHAHFTTPWYAQAARDEGHELPDGMPGYPGWDPEEHLRLMDRNGIDQAVLSISSPGVHFGDDDAAADLARRVNDHAAAVCRRWPDRFRFFASLPVPAVEESLSEIARALDELGAAGVVVETNVGGTYLSDETLEPVLTELDARAAVMFVHPTSPPGWQETALGYPRPMVEFLMDTTRTVASLIMGGHLERHPDLRVVVSHCGAFVPMLVERLKMFAVGLGTGDADPESIDRALGRLWYDMAGTPVPTQAEALIGKAGTSRLLYGSDYCWTPGPLVDRQVASLDAGWDAARHGPWRELVAANASALWEEGPGG